MNTLRLSVVSLSLFSALAPAQSWSELTDAGELLRSAQRPIGYGPLSSISGVLTGGADAFVIQIDDPAAFSASTVGGATWDTLLSLFDEQGFGVTSRDDQGSGVLQSTLTGAFVPARGRYVLAISHYACEPVAGAGPLWNISNTTVERRPDGMRRTEAFTGWNGGASGGSYTIALAGCSFPAQQIVLPDNHHLSESPGVLFGSGSTAWWRDGGCRFQIVYEASHLLAAGANGPVTIKKLRFRAEDGEVHPGGITWPQVLVQLGATSLTGATLNTSFATNRGSSVTTLAPAAVTAVTSTAATGATPNAYVLEIDLEALGATLSLDPTSARPNLLIDINYATPPTVPPAVVAPVAMQDAGGSAALVRGAGVTSTTSSASTGTLTASPLVVALDVTGAGGDRFVVPARNEPFGAACGGQPSAFYQAFRNGQRSDLLGLRLQPDNALTPTRYTVFANSTGVDATKVGAVPDSIGDDALVTHTLGFTFRYPGGSTTTIRASTNGFLWLDGASAAADPSPTVGEFLGGGGEAARLAPFWTDLHAGRNTATHPNSGLHVVTDTSGGPGNAKCYVTWYDVGLYNTVAAGGIAVVRVQCVLGEDGTVEYRYTTLPRWCGATSTNGVAVLTGFCRGQIGATASLDPGSRDLSFEVPFDTAPEGGNANLVQTVQALPVAANGAYGARAFPGQAMRWNVDNVPAGTLLGAQLLDIEASRPGLALPGITAPGCVLGTTTNATLWEVHLQPPSSITGGRALLIPPGFDGFELFAQYVVLDGLFGGPQLVTAASNAVRTVVGKQ